jgi:ATP-binding cassette subfamily B multidrug efflux pump
MKMLSLHPTVVDTDMACPLIVSKGEIIFEKVSFSYGYSKQRAIDCFDFKVLPGEKVGLVGCSGAGKSTLLNLLLRFYDVEEGRILIDGVDIANVTQETLRSQIAVVTQDTSLLHRTVAENVAYGSNGATIEEVITAARKAEAHNFICNLTHGSEQDGYEFNVGERGVKLSGGQRQRVAIARAILKDAPILLLDEATSALDSEVEALIQKSLHELMKDKTVIAIAHRLSTIAHMDRLIVIDNGRLVEQGSHNELLAYGGVYARLWSLQIRDSINYIHPR